MIESMAKIEIIGLFEELDSTLDILQQVGTVEIDEIPAIEESKQTHIHRIHLDETKEHLKSRYEELMHSVSEILEILKEGSVEEAPLGVETRDELLKLSPDELIEHTSRMTRDVRRLGRQQRNLCQDIESTRQYEMLINIFLPLLEKAGSIGELEQIGIILKRDESSIIPILKNRLDEITGPETQFFNQKMSDGRTGVFMAIAHEDLSAVRRLLGTEGVAEYHIPREFRKKNLSESIESIRERIEEIPNELAEIDRKLLEVKKSHISLFRFIHSISADRLNQLSILSRLVRTQYTFVLSGWVPASKLEILQEKIHKQFDNRVYIGRVTLSDLDFLHVPTLLSNKGFFHAFEVLLKLLPPPKYGNLDATPFITFFFPLFFGIILGDMAYGFILLAIAGMINWKAARGSL
ncbi:MAG: hypothetical protein HOC71_18405, partial [Candidatus Latescibacteria bacterium]|nr:hypothetical protein [Candidatus Latescibacterota bacterium]